MLCAPHQTGDSIKKNRMDRTCGRKAAYWDFGEET
jgi:hypothetical protein